MAKTRRKTAIIFDAINLEGSLIAPAMLERIAARAAGEQSESDYSIPKGLTLRDEIARYYRIGQAHYKDFNSAQSQSLVAPIKLIERLFSDVFGFQAMEKVGTRSLGERVFAITLEGLSGRVPVVVTASSDALDRVSEFLQPDGRKRSAASAVQDWLNASEDSLWGFCSNGQKLRLVRDNASLTRPAYIEADLKQIFENDNFADFTTLWLLIHASRFGAEGKPVSDCALERWRETGSKEGVAARDRLRDGVEAALLSLGNGFLSHENNTGLRDSLTKGELPLPVFFNQLLRLVYRLIFLLAAEDRNVLHPPSATLQSRTLYAEGYSLDLLRKHSIRRAAWDRYHDRWEGLSIVFDALAQGEALLGLPALGGLFGKDQIADLQNAVIANRALLEAVYRLAWLKDDNRLTPVNWRDMETEELGSVYESLLELTPRLHDNGRGFSFAEGAETKGNTRKTTGSYYTPDSLVQALLDTALDPVLDRIEAEASNSSKELLKVSVIDPACGSGHFLLAAARRIAGRIARNRAGGVASAEDYRHALRDVARSCIYGVDRNPMAVELTKVALWIETVEPGKPLGFLDANIRCGDALFGLFDLDPLKKGIPDEAYSPLAGDDKATAKYYLRLNKAERDNQGTLDFAGGGGQMPAPPPLELKAREVRELPEENAQDILEKKQKYEAAQADPARCIWRTAADMYVAAFLAPKTGGEPTTQTPATVPTTGQVWKLLSGNQVNENLIANATKRARDARAFHWSLEFPDIMSAGGFDVVLGNPPWERIKLQEKEFFAASYPEIANAKGKSARESKIKQLESASVGSLERILFDAFQQAKREAEASSEFVRIPEKDGGRFPLTGAGDVNTYALFAELFSRLAKAKGRAGIIVPTGIATDATTAPFFASLVEKKRLSNLIDFENRERIFIDVYFRVKFCLLTIGENEKEANFAFFLTNPAQLTNPHRNFTLSPEEIERLNPNTRTAPVFRSRADAELTAKIYTNSNILIDKSNGRQVNPWDISFLSMFHMSNDSGLFRTAKQLADQGFTQEGRDWLFLDDQEQIIRYVPLYEGKMAFYFDHRYGDFSNAQEKDDADYREIPRPTSEQLQNPNFEVLPRYWVPEQKLIQSVEQKGWNAKWLFAHRGLTNATNERTFVTFVLPLSGLGNSIPAWIFNQVDRPQKIAALIANAASLVCDFAARQKIGGTNLNFFYLEQFPILPPTTYKDIDLDYITSRVLELTYTSHSLTPFARDLGYEGEPFAWNEERRALLKAELDAWYAKAYGLTRDELRYILDPADVMGEDYPSETFRVLKEREIKEYGEYRTRRLVLEAWDRMNNVSTQSVAQNIVVDFTRLPEGAWMRPVPSDIEAATLAQLAAIMKRMPSNTAASRVRLAALYALEPRYLTRRLSGADRATWLRLVGQDAQDTAGGNIVAFAPRVNAAWRNAVTQLIGMSAIIEDANAQTWSAGTFLQSFPTDGWPDGRAAFIMSMMENMSSDDATAELAAEDQQWVISNAA